MRTDEYELHSLIRSTIYADTKSEICWSYITEMENMPAVHRQKAKKKKKSLDVNDCVCVCVFV